MVSRTLPTSLILSLALVSVAACTDDTPADTSTTFVTMTTETGDMTMSMTNETGTADQGDGDPRPQGTA